MDCDAPSTGVKFRLSNYTIFVDLPHDECLLIHGYSGAWDIVDSHLAQGLRRFRRGPAFVPLIGQPFSDESPNDGAESIECLPCDVSDLLVKRGYLTTLSAVEEQSQVSTLATNLHAMATHEAPSYVFALSYACNLRCAYCFQDQLRTKPENAPRLVDMTQDMVDRIFSIMPEIESRHGCTESPRPVRRITLFGGEPLVPQLRPLVEYVVSSARCNGPATLSAVTNGTGLQHFRHLLGPDGISFVQITLDGAPEEHDKRRVGPAGLKTFQQIADNIDLALGCGVQVKVRINTDKTNLESLPSLAELMDNRGWFASNQFSAYATPIHETGGSAHQACGFGSWNLTRRLAELADEHPLVRLVHGPDAPWKRRIRDILRSSRDPLLSFQPSFCGAHTQTWVFDAHGDIYACWERAGYVSERIGRLTSDAKLQMIPAMEQKWRSRTIAANPICGRCPYAFYCGGGCALLAERKNGKLHSNYCDDFSQRFKRLAAEEVSALRIDSLAQLASSLRKDSAHQVRAS